MGVQPETRKLLHGIRAKCASLKSASDLLGDNPDEQALEMLDLMTQQARELLRCLLELKKTASGARDQ